MVCTRGHGCVTGFGTWAVEGVEARSMPRFPLAKSGHLSNQGVIHPFGGFPRAHQATRGLGTEMRINPARA